MAGPWVIDTRDIGRRPGTSHRYHREAAVEHTLGFEPVIMVPEGSTVTFDALAESVVEGVLMSGTATAHTEGECSRCLDPLTDSVEVEFTELFAYPDSLTEATTDEDEIYRITDESDRSRTGDQGRDRARPAAGAAVLAGLPGAVPGMRWSPGRTRTRPRA